MDRGLNACGYALPGGSIAHITSRIRHMKPSIDPQFVMLMAGDIEAVDRKPAETICTRYEHLLKETRRSFPWSRIVLSGLPQTGNIHRQNTIRKVNSYLEAVALDERLVEFACNANAKLRDNVHLANSSKEKLCYAVSKIVKKVFL